MMKPISLFAVLFLLGGLLTAQSVDLNYYLPQNVQYNPDIPTPKSVLGYEVGDWHVRHDQLVEYMRTLANASDRVTIREIGRTYEHRPLVVLTITSVANHQRLEEIKAQHVALSDPRQSGDGKLDDLPAVVYEGFSIHGNESSGSNAALLAAYYLAAAEGEAIEELLNNVVVLLDPSLNPDGFNRFANWVNMHKSKTLVTDPASRELNEYWPSGRTNHYWFDLNRDWLPVQHPESQARIKIFHEWKPNILTDHHEMGSHNTFFFQPGIPSRTNPITPEKNQKLTHDIARYHAKALDQIGSLYYSEESFDDFYYGKGSTYPDVNGCIGILFEQASARGHLRQTRNGLLSFPFSIRNQFSTALSTLEAAKSLRGDLLQFQRDFYQNAMKEAQRDTRKAFVIGNTEDHSRMAHLLDLLRQHQIEVYRLAKDTRVGDQDFKAANSYVIPTEQTQYRLIRGMFEKLTVFEDSLFYDVSSWTLPLAFNIPYAELNGGAYSKNLLGEALGDVVKPSGKIIGGKSDYAYLFEWTDYYAPKVLYELQNSGLRLKVASKPFTALTSTGARRFDYGTVLLSAQGQDISADEVYSSLQKAVEESGLEVYSMATGLTPTGIDLGSPSFKQLKKPNVLLIAGQGVSAYDAGEVWHLLDQRYQMPVTIIDASDLSYRTLDRYTAVVMVNGSYGRITASGKKKLEEWLRRGGVLVACRQAVQWAASSGLAGVRYKSNGNSKAKKPLRPYIMEGPDSGAQVIGGAIFSTKADLSHPLLYGYEEKELPIFRRGTMFLERSKNPYATPLVYDREALLSGYISKGNSKKLSNSAGIIVSGLGRGRTVCLADNPNFRAFWYGTNKLFANALFFGATIDGGTTESVSVKKEEE
ncbi:MAG: M14 family zinc carboxypeptidase [Bacteroidota bacterium]